MAPDTHLLLVVLLHVDLHEAPVEDLRQHLQQLLDHQHVQAARPVQTCRHGGVLLKGSLVYSAESRWLDVSIARFVCVGIGENRAIENRL